MFGKKLQNKCGNAKKKSKKNSVNLDKKLFDTKKKENVKITFLFQTLECKAFQKFRPLLNFQTLKCILFFRLFLFFLEKRKIWEKSYSIRTALRVTVEVVVCVSLELFYLDIAPQYYCAPGRMEVYCGSWIRWLAIGIEAAPIN